MIPLYIFDLDGTLALIDHRRHLLDRGVCEACSGMGGIAFTRCAKCGGLGEIKSNWPAFYAACVDDEPNHAVIDTMQRLLKSGADVWIWSGRSAEVMEQTREWLMRCADAADCELVMRVPHDFTPDDQLKQSWLDAMSPYDRRRLVAVFDDRNKVVDMWRRNGIACFQVAPGEF